MASPGQQPRLGATFYPGGTDDFYMPELMSPAPQRVMPEVPSNMQEGLAHLELEARESQTRDRRTSSVSSVSTVSLLTPYGDHQQSSMLSQRGLSFQQQPIIPELRGPIASYEHTNESAYQNVYKNGLSQVGKPTELRRAEIAPLSLQKTSPFPKLQNAGPTVPLSEEEKEEVLERARPLVLNSNDPEMQLAWAQDALLWVEAAMSNRSRLPSEQPLRSSTPKVEHLLRVDAISIINFLANQQHPRALFMKGTWYEGGKFGCALDTKEAFREYRSATEKGYARAEYRIGTLYESMHDMVKAMKHYGNGVALGDAASTYRMGMMSLLGQHGRRQDFRLGIEQIKYAAEMADENSPQGAYIYGMLLARDLPGITVPDAFLPYDTEQAKQFIAKAAYLGFAKAQQKMGQAYELCLLGCEFNPALSLHYNALAARQGEAEADMALSKWFLCGFDGIFEKNEELAFTYAQRAAQGGLATAEFAMGYFYEIGMYVSTDLQQAQIWYRQASDHGNKDAGPRLQGISQHKTLNKIDHEQIAITRIKSQYGSRREVRPDRFKEKPLTLPSMAEDVIDMPDHSHHARTGAETARLSTPAISRPKSTAPYPENDVAPSQGYTQRSASATVEPNLRSRTGPPADRPMSAFGIRPQIAQPGQEPMRSTATTGTMPTVNSGSRISIASAGWEPQTYRQSSPNRGVPTPRFPSEPVQGKNRLQQGLPQRIKLGHPALATDSSYPPLLPQSRNEKPLPAPHPRHDDYGAQPAPLRTRKESSPHRSQQSYDSRVSLTSNGGHGVERSETMSPNMGHAAQQRPPISMSSASTQSLPSRIASAPVPTNSTTTIPSAPTKPTKEGPKTFDEMGIHQAKNESDCCVM